MNPSRPRGEPPPPRPPFPSSPGDPSSARGERARIWIVDDSPLEIEMARRVLSELYEVDVFVDGASMLERRAGGLAPDTIVLDCQMPGMSGVEVCRFLRGTTDEVGLPILMLTVQGHKQDVVEGLAAGANDYVTKPYDAAELLARVGTLVRTKQLYERVKRAERACAVERGRLAQSEQRLRMVAEAIPQIVWTATAEGAVDFVNQRWFDFTGLTMEASRAHGWHDIVHPDDREDAAARWARSIATGEVYELQLRLRRAADGEHRWYLGRALPLRDAEGRVSKWFGTFTDIDDQKLAERKIDTLARTGAELEGQNQRMKEANRLKSEFVANLSHELRTPLNAIIGFAQTVRSSKVGAVSAEHKVYLDDILTSSRHLLQLINDVLDLAKIESGKIEFRPQPIDIARTVAEVRDVLRGVAEEKGMVVVAEIHGNLSDVVLDPSRLKQVLYNYLSNAIKFTPAGGQVTVCVKSAGPSAFRVDVVDTGIGIRPEDLHRLFVEFQQLDADAAKRHPGTGLGLSLTKRIVEAQGGTVAVQSAPGKGSTFSAILPRSRAT